MGTMRNGGIAAAKLFDKVHMNSGAERGKENSIVRISLIKQDCADSIY